MGHAMIGHRDRPVALCLFALLFSVYLLTFSGVYHSSDEMSMLAVTDSLARRGAWDIELLRWMGEQQGSFGPDGYLYSRKGIGMTLAALPQYWLALQSQSIGNVQIAMLTNGLTTALTGALIYLLLRRLGYNSAVSILVTLAFGLGTMAWPYARYLFSESLAGLGLMLSFYFLVRFRDEQGTGSLLWAGAGLGVALLARLNNAIVAPFLGLLLLVYLYRQHGRAWRRWIGPVVLYGLPVLAALAIAGWHNWLRFGNALTTGYLPQERFSTPFFEGLYGLTFSPGKGLFWYNPILLAALVAWPAFFRRQRAEALLVAAVVLSNMAFYAPWYLWWAGHAWGPRFLVTMLPFAALPLAPAVEAAFRRRALALALGALVAISVAVQMLGVAVDFNLYLEDIYAELGLYHPATFFDPAYSPLLRQIAYLLPGNLDIAWARGNTLDWIGLLTGLGLVLASALALWSAKRGRIRAWMTGGLLVLLVVGVIVSLLRYAPDGDVPQAAHALASMEEPGEVAALTEPLWTEAFQDAYDGRLWVWGVPSKEEVASGPSAVWSAGQGDPDPATARFQVGEMRLDYFPISEQPFDASRLPVALLADKPRLDDAVELLAVQTSGAQVAPGETLSVALYWRVLAPLDTSYTVFVQVIDERGGKLGQIDRLPCDGGCPTTTWRPGDLIGERYDLSTDVDAAPGRYQIISGMYDLRTGENLPWVDAQGDPLGSYLIVGNVDVQ
jgi:4-amino-4-deoxy-L-arabinose transferase-like glycosyltransferase